MRQNYGTCVECDEGWAGYDCNTVQNYCSNGGTKNRVTGGCNCRSPWTGEQCLDLKCIHTVGGQGPESVVPVNGSNQCPGPCQPGWDGLACDLCNSNESAQCSNGTYCLANTVVAHGTEMAMECVLTDNAWLTLLGFGAAIKVWVKAVFKNPNGWNDKNSDGIQHLSLWRLQPNGIWFEPYFYCAFEECGMRHTQEVIRGVAEPRELETRARAKTMRTVLGIILYTICGIIAFNGIVKTRWFERIFVVAAIVLAVATLGMLILLANYGHQELAAQKEVRYVTYDCTRSSCRCAHDPPSDHGMSPRCSTSDLANHYFPQMTNGATFKCDEDAHNCSLIPVDMGGTVIALHCRAAQCAEFSSFAAEKSKIPTDPLGVAVSACIGFGALIVLLFAHWMLSHRRFVRLRAQFNSLYHSEIYPANRKDDSGECDREMTRIVSNKSTPPSSGGSQMDEMHTPLLVDSSPSLTAEQSHDMCVLELCNASYSVPLKGHILLDVSLTARSGETLAIIGSSGAGKTTLLDILARRPKIGTVTGKLYVNGIETIGGNTAIYKRMIGYVGQEENLNPSLTVRQTIMYAARLKLPAPISDRAVLELVDETLEALNLVHCAQTKIGSESSRGISGGEKRRVSIASELVANPRILFLDEPTSGLDSVSAQEVIYSLARLCRSGPVAEGSGHRNCAVNSVISTYRKFFSFRPAIIFSIHQPSKDIFATFDRVLVLEFGRITYFGPASEMVNHMKLITLVKITEVSEEDLPHFSNPAEWVLMLQHMVGPSGIDVLVTSPSPGSETERMASLSVLLQSINQRGRGILLKMTAENQKFYLNQWQQINLLASRTWASLMGSYYLIASHAVALVFLGVVLTFLYFGQKLNLEGTLNKAGMMTFLLLIIAFQSLSSLELFIVERSLVAAELDNRYYGSLPYYVVKVLFDFIPLRIVPTLLLAGTIYYPMGLRDDRGVYFFWFCTILVMFSLFVTGMCICVAMVAPSFGSGALFASVLILWNALFTSLIAQSETVPPLLKPFRFTSPFYYAFEGLMINELDGQECIFNPLDASSGKKKQWEVPILCRQFVYNFGLDPENFTRDVMLLLAGAISFAVLGLILLHFAVRLRK